MAKRYYVGDAQRVDVLLPGDPPTEIRLERGDSVDVDDATAEALDACPANWSARSLSRTAESARVNPEWQEPETSSAGVGPVVPAPLDVAPEPVAAEPVDDEPDDDPASAEDVAAIDAEPETFDPTDDDSQDGE